MMIPAISLWQPWASLCFAGDPDLRKEHETRHWRYPARLEGATIAMHAAQRFPQDEVTGDLYDLCVEAFGSDFRRTLPRGALIGTFRLIGCYRTEEIRGRLPRRDIIAGNYGDCRFAWQISEAQAFANPIPYKGRQGWFNVDRDIIEGTSHVE